MAKTLSTQRQRMVRTNVKAWVMLLPALLSMLTFTHWPFVQTIILSFYRKKMSIAGEKFVGFSNYQAVMKDPYFGLVASNTVIFTLIVVPISLALGLLFAYLLNKNIKGKGLFRTFLFYPNVAPAVGFYLVWVYLLQDTIGFVNNILRIFGLQTHNWLASSDTALGVIIVLFLWREATYIMLFFLSGLQSINTEYYEAATIDGANEWQKFWRVTFPLLMPTTVYAMTMAISGATKVLDVISIVTGGGPTYHSSMMLHYIYSWAFGYWNQGMAATYSVIFLGITLLIIAFQQFSMDKVSNYEE